jgi:hypothetical protein
MQISFSRPPDRCIFHSDGLKPDANCIWLAAMQYKIPKFINSLHVAGNQPNETASGWQLVDANFAEISCFHIVKLLVFRKDAEMTFKNN